MKITTIKLQNLVTKAIKGAGFNKLLPITSIIGIKSDGINLQLCTSDGTNYLVIGERLENLEFNISVDAELFSKLISKMTCDNITLTVDNNVLVVEGNGIYKLPLSLDDNGEFLVYPDSFGDVDSKPLGSLDTATIGIMLNTIKPTLATNMSSPVYTNYLIGEYIVSTDRTMLNAYKNPNPFSSDRLFSRELVDLLGLATDKVELSIADNLIIAKSGDITVYSKAKSDATEFNSSIVKKIIDLTYDSYCKLKKSELSAIIDRAALFVSEYDNSTISMVFTESGIEITPNNDSGAELIEYMESKDFKPISIKIDVTKLATQLKAYQSDSVELYYGDSKFIKLQDGDIIQVTALVI